jgi:hypothetical protein
LPFSIGWRVEWTMFCQTTVGFRQNLPAGVHLFESKVNFKNRLSVFTLILQEMLVFSGVMPSQNEFN